MAAEGNFFFQNPWKKVEGLFHREIVGCVDRTTVGVVTDGVSSTVLADTVLV